MFFTSSPVSSFNVMADQCMSSTESREIRESSVTAFRYKLSVCFFPCVSEQWSTEEKRSEWKIHCSLIQKAFLWQPNIFKQRLKAAMPYSTSSHTLWSFLLSFYIHTWCCFHINLCLPYGYVLDYKTDVRTVTLNTLYRRVSTSTSAIWLRHK